MLNEAFAGPPAPTSSPGVNATKRLALSDGATVFHKPFSGVSVANALAFGQTDETPPLHDAVAWRVAVALGEPWQSLVSPCVLREQMVMTERCRCRRRGGRVTSRRLSVLRGVRRRRSSTR